MNARVVALAIGAAAWPACVEPTEIVFEVTTDQPCSMLGSTAISVGTLGPDLDSRSPTSVSTHCEDTGLLGKLVVTPSPVKAELGVRIVVGVGKSGEKCIADGLKGGCIVARRALNFINHTVTNVRVSLERSCVDVPCASNQTCVKGQGVDARTCPNAGCGTPPGSQWKPIRSSPLSDRSEMAFGAVGRKVLIWGGYTDQSGPHYTNDGAIYDVANDQWSTVSTSPLSARGKMSATRGSASDIVIFGGSNNSPPYLDGAIYHVDSDTWTHIPDAPISMRDNPAIAWSTATDELIVWGGSPATSAVNDGARWSMQNGWTIMSGSPLGPREGAASVWTGKEVFIYGGVDGNNAASGDFAFYNSSPEGWTVPASAPIDGRAYAFAGLWKDKLVLWGGDANVAPSGPDGFDNGCVLDGTGKLVDAIGAPPISQSKRNVPRAVIAGDKLWMWGGESDDMVTNTGALYDLMQKTWSAIEPSPLVPRASFAYAWTGQEVFVWGGFATPTDQLGDGALFVP